MALHLQKSLPENLKNKDLNLKNSEYIGRNGLYLPVGRHVKKKHQKFIYEKIRIFLKVIYQIEFYPFSNCTFSK